jgi:crossover junction endodeoxyribonuclease RuvC
MPNILYTGVDPGKKGAIATMNADGNILRISRFSAAETEGRIALIIADHISELGEPCHATAIEKVGAMPRQGLSSTFTFGRVCGEAWAGLILYGAKVHAVTATRWQSDFGLPKREEYAAHKRMLKQTAETRWARKFVLDEVDAVWLAEWSRLRGPWSRGTE